MIEECKNGNVDIVLCKTQARFARDMELVEKYVHNLFHEWNVRFITVVDKIDNARKETKKTSQILGLTDEWYLEDTSLNIRETLKSKRKDGQLTSSFATYGYMKDPENKNHLIIDPISSLVIKRIYDEYLSGNGLDKEASGRTSGNGFYYLMGDAARLSSAMLSYARDFMIDKGFTYCIPPFMIRSSVVNGVMSFAEMDAMMYKIEGEDLYLIGTSEHSMIGKFKGELIKENTLPITMTSYSPCFRKEVGAHGIEERGIYRVHQFEKQEMIVLCRPEESMDWYNKMWKFTVELFRSLDIPVRTLECCSGDLADLKVKSCDIEAWSPRQQKYFEVGSCSTLGDAQARRLGIRVKGENGNYYPHTLNNTVLASTRALIALLENNYNEDGTVTIPKVLRPYMGNKERI